MPHMILRLAVLGFALCAAATSISAENERLLVQSKKRVPSPPWPAGDERGMANALGPGTWLRCGWHLGHPDAAAFELSYLRSNTMPKSPFTGPYVQKYKPTAGVPGSIHAFNGEQYEAGAEPAGQATQIDALGHFAFLRAPWDGKAPFPSDEAVYYGGFAQKDVKPDDASPLLRLGMEKAPPIITTAVLLDAKSLVGGGRPMKAGDLVTSVHIEAMLKAQGLERRGILPGDVVLIRTGWGDHWRDPDSEQIYYTQAPGLAVDAAQYLGERRIVALGLDTPFIDPVPAGLLAGKAGPAAGTPPGQPFAVHHHLLTQKGIHHLENMNLTALADQRVWTSCFLALPLLQKGAAGSPVRPVAVGVPAQDEPKKK